MKKLATGKIVSKIYLGIVFLFLYAPIIVLMVFSFNESKSRANFTGFTFKWYQQLFKNELIMRSLMYTIIIALLSAIIATVIGTIAALGISNMKKTPRTIVMNVSYLPIINPEIVTGVSLMLLFVFIGRLIGATNSLSFGTLLIAHVTFNLPYVILNVLPKLNQTDPHLAEAAQDLGSTPIRAFFSIVLPSIMPGIASGLLMSFTLSLDDFVISYYTTGSDFQTLPLKIFAMTKKTVKPDMYAISSLIFVTVLVLLLIINIVQIQQMKKDAQKKN